MTPRSIASLCLLVAGLILSGCSKVPDETRAISVSAHEIIEIAEDLGTLKADFNAAVDQLRLLFIVGPT